MIKLLVILFFVLISFNGFSYTILLDPGHGGEDTGATGVLITGSGKSKIETTIFEKNISLDLSKKIFKRLKKLNYDVYLTRSIDREVSLQERADLAEKIKANLFISIHFNASLRRKSNGFETFYLDNHKDAAIEKVEEVENKGLKGEALIVQQILIDLVVERTVVTSKALADIVHKKISKNLKRSYQMQDRGAKPGLFYVLALSKRPGLLLEPGFMSNPRELSKLLSDKFQNGYADAVADGIHLYIQSLKKNQISLL